MTPTKTATKATPNVMTFEDVLATASELGKQAGQGKDTQIKFLYTTVEAAFHNAINMDRNKHGTGVDDAEKLTEAYVKAQTGNTVFDAKAPNIRKAVSLTRTSIKLGQWPKGGHGEPMQTVNDLLAHFKKERGNPKRTRKLDDAANVLMKYARQQLKRDTLIDRSEFEEMVYRTERDLKSAENVIESVRKQLYSLQQGKAQGGTALDNSERVQSAIKELTERLKEYADERKPSPSTTLLANAEANAA